MKRHFVPMMMLSGAIASALAFYLVTLQVANERAAVDGLRRAIARDTADLRALDTELRTRARLPQLQRWNDTVFALAAPAAGQFVGSPLQLVRGSALAALPSPAPATLAAQARPAPIVAAIVVADRPAARAATTAPTPRAPAASPAAYRVASVTRPTSVFVAAPGPAPAAGAALAPIGDLAEAIDVELARVGRGGGR